jgi:hypothetical protein
MRSAPHDIRAAHRNEIAGIDGRASDFLRHRELANPSAAGAEGVARFDGVVVVAGHRQSGRARDGGDTIQRRGDSVGP